MLGIRSREMLGIRSRDMLGIRSREMLEIRSREMLKIGSGEMLEIRSRDFENIIARSNAPTANPRVSVASATLKLSAAQSRMIRSKVQTLIPSQAPQSTLLRLCRISK